MSIIVTLRVQGDPSKLEQFAAGNPDGMRSIAEQAKQHGVIAHRFYGSDDGQILVADEWPDAESFQAFFQQEGERIKPMLDAAGVSSEPEVTFWRSLDTLDGIGWGS